MDLICKTAQPETESQQGTLTQDDPEILCRSCGHSITRPDFRIMKADSFSHTFANPYGHVFEIGCFSKAPGCVTASSPSDEFSWFKGYDWSVGICSQCASQLGWIFSSASDTFYGLILDQLIFP